MKKTTLLLFIAGALTLGSCIGLSRLAAFSKCKFEFEKIENVKLATVNVDKANSITKLGLMDIGKITKAIVTKELQLDLTAVVKIINPNKKTAALNKTDWILKVDGLEITRGTTNQRIEIPAGGFAYMPVNTSFNLIKTFSGESKTKLYNLARNIAGLGDEPSKIEFMVKPTLSVAGVMVPYPEWITLHRKVGDAR